MRLTWDGFGSRQYETGADRGVFYPSVGPGVSWNGLVGVTETTEEANQTVLYIDGESYHIQLSLGFFSATLTALTYPHEFEEYDGYVDDFSGQPRKSFNFSYRTLIGSDRENSTGYKLHLVYNAIADPSNRDMLTLGEENELGAFIWDVTTTPVEIPGLRASSHIILDSTQTYPAALAEIEDILYGSSSLIPQFPTISQIMAIFEDHAIFMVVDNGNGTATITGPDDWVYEVAPDQYYISSPSVVHIDEDRVRASSY